MSKFSEDVCRAAMDQGERLDNERLKRDLDAAKAEITKLRAEIRRLTPKIVSSNETHS